jgi:hypothetical protein
MLALRENMFSNIRDVGFKADFKFIATVSHSSNRVAMQQRLSL